MRFEHPLYLTGLAAVPLLLLLWWLSRRTQRKRLARVGRPEVVAQQLLGRIAGRSGGRMLLASLALALTVVAIANPQYNGGRSTGKRRGVDVIVALDVSRSMLAADVSPDRISRARLCIQLLLDKLQGHRVGLVLFAGRAYLQAPLTTDYSAVRMLLQSATPDAIGEQGTALAAAIRQSAAAFSPLEKKYKMLVLLTDGEDHEEDALKAAAEAAGEGVIIHTAGVGSEGGSTLRDPETGALKQDENGQPVVSKLNETELKGIAEAGHGSYSLLSNPAALADALAADADSMESRSLGTTDYTEYESAFQWLLLPALLLLVIDAVLPGARRIQTKVIS